jgi:uncharacterized membrane-anchored protein YitT (DUF2179 family)
LSTPTNEIKSNLKTNKKELFKQGLDKKLNALNYKNFIFLIIAGAVNAVGVALLLIPAGIIDGGLSGFSYLLSKYIPVKMSYFILFLNLPFFIFAFRKKGRNFIFYSLTAILSYSIFMYLFQYVFKFCGNDLKASPIINITILNAIFGGLVSGIGSGLTIRSGGSIDGIDVVAVFLYKKIGMSIGTIVMVFNSIMYIVAGFLVGFEYPLYSIIAYYAGIKAIDAIIEGLDKTKAVMIITEKGQEVAQSINDNMEKGITLIKGSGFYSKTEKTVIYYVVNRFDIGKIKNIISYSDPSAFISIIEVSEILGSDIARSKKKKLKN